MNRATHHSSCPKQTKQTTRVAARLLRTSPERRCPGNARFMCTLVMLAGLLAASGTVMQTAAFTPSASLPAAAIPAAAAIDTVDDDQPVTHARRLQDEPPPIEGTLDHPAWQKAPLITDFIQRMPDSGEPATHRTEVRLLYDDNYLYVGARMHDPAPDSILAPLMHPDSFEPSDFFGISVDSYRDRRTAFTFLVNPRGVRIDQMQHSDYMEDSNWTAVWDAEARIDDQGWVTTLRIPLSQLRYRGGGEQTWGVNFVRQIARENEMSTWAHVPPDQMRFVSLYGTLDDLQLPESRVRLEATPYLSGGLNHKASSLRTPLDDNPEFQPGAGLDLQYGLTPGVTLTSTINPDFGQVQVDPAVINLSAFETFFPERRPFFTEGSEIFDVNGTRTYNVFARPRTFYTRRIGAPPQGSPPAGDYQDISRPSETGILGAVKLSGQTMDGWSVGVTNAVTGTEHAELLYPGGETAAEPIAPLTNHFMGVLERQSQDGDSQAGVHAGAINRFTERTYLAEQLAGNQYLAGANFEHVLSEGKWAVSGLLQASHVQGSAAAVERLQREPMRYFQRPDADHLDYDPDRTSLTGWHSELSLARISGNVTGSVTWNTASPAYHVNGMGFQRRADFHAVSSLLRYADFQTTDLLQEWNVQLRNETAWNYAGQLLNAGLTGSAFLHFRNNWRVRMSAGVSPETYDVHLTRGGPIARQPAGYTTGLSVFSDQNRDLYGSLGVNMEGHQAGNRSVHVNGSLRYSPYYSVSLRLEPGVSLQRDRAQYLASLPDSQAGHTYGNRYLFSELDLMTVDLGLRMRWTLNPDLSIQLFAQPLLSSGRFSRFSELAEPGTYAFTEYGVDAGRIEQLDGGYRITPEQGDAFRLEDPDFLRRSLRANAVLSWEYLPGSELFLVWQLNQFDHEFGRGRQLQPLSDYRQLGVAPAEHTLMIKLTRWFSR